MDLNRLVEDYGLMVSAIAHRMIQDKNLAREAAQETWYEVLKSLSSFNNSSQLSTWIYTIARRTVMRYLQNEKAVTLARLEYFRALPEIEYDDADKEHREWVKERCDWCLTALNHCLTDDARLIFIFRITIGLPYAEIGRIMEMSNESVRQTGTRAIHKVSNFMSDTCPLYNPSGTCKCRIRRQVKTIRLDEEYRKMQKAIRLTDLYQRFDKELPRKNYWKNLLG